MNISPQSEKPTAIRMTGFYGVLSARATQTQ